MRLWHYKLIQLLPRQQLLGLHREVCAMRGLGWSRKHSTVDYVWKYSYNVLFNYHWMVMWEMKNRGYQVDPAWLIPDFRGRRLDCLSGKDYETMCIRKIHVDMYPEHNDEYLQECLDNLKNKGIILDEFQ